MNLRVLAVMTLHLLIGAAVGMSAQQLTSMPRLFEQLRSEATTDQAMQEYLKLGPSNLDAGKYLAERLPRLISQDPKNQPHVWMNAVRLAGVFQTTEAIPALAKVIGVPASESGTSTLAETSRLEPFPAGKAMVRIGEPAVPTLVGVLEKGNSRERWVAYRALFMIGSPGALSGLRDHLSHEPDSTFKAEVQKALEGK
jgi:HEAT repeat protein